MHYTHTHTYTVTTHYNKESAYTHTHTYTKTHTLCICNTHLRYQLLQLLLVGLQGLTDDGAHVFDEGQLFRR